MTSRAARLILAPLASALLVAASTTAWAGHGMARQGLPYGHPPCHSAGMPGGAHGMPSHLGGMPGHGGGMCGQAHAMQGHPPIMPGQGYGMYGPPLGMQGHPPMCRHGFGMHGKRFMQGHPHGMWGHPGHAQAGESTATDGKDLLDTAVAAGSFSTLAKAIETAGLTETLRGAGPFTVFAPTDAAFAKLPKEKLDALLADREKLAAVLKYHVVAGRLTAAELLEQGQATTVQGQTVSVGGLDVAKADIVARNGIIHAIDAVLLPTL